jgi:hypothetical protein
VSSTGVDRRRNRAVLAVRVGLAAFVLGWLLDVLALQSSVPIWLPFLVALGLELHFFASARAAPVGGLGDHDRAPQPVDRDRFGYPEEPTELLLVRRGDEEFWIPYSGEDVDVDTLIAEERERAQRDDDHPPPRRRQLPGRQLLVGLVLVGALAAIAWVADTHTGWNGLDADTRAEAAARFSDEASRLADRPVTIQCDEAGDYVGAVQHADGAALVGGRVAYLTTERCFDLYRLAFKGDESGSQTGRAVAVLAHETWHLRGVRDEATTECYALQSGVDLGQRFGLSEATARQMMRQQLTENELHSGTSLAYRLAPDCHDGGTLDLHPGSSEFP